MPGNSFGTLFCLTTFGESHGKALGAILQGVPPGVELSPEDIQKELDRRRPGQSEITTPRREDDRVEICSGIFEGRTTGAPLMMIIYNTDARSGDYGSLKDLFRPGHADYTWEKKYGVRDYRGGGRASGRETAARVAAGAVARKILRGRGVEITAFTLRAAGISGSAFDPGEIEKNPLRAADPAAAARMAEKIRELAARGDSAGGVIECRVTGAPAGLGEPVFDKLDARLAQGILSIGGIKGIEFGSGFAGADSTGRENNDGMDARGFLTNHAGGILGGISTGGQIVFRAAVKPTPSIAGEQKTLDSHGRERIISVEGRHDVCLCPRIVPVVEAMTALVLEDFFKLQGAVSI